MISNQVKAEKLYTVEEAAKYLGLTVQSLYNLRHRGRAPKAIRVGRRIRFPESELVIYVEKLKAAAK